jgi:Fe2+ transport system protein FeoA
MSEKRLRLSQVSVPSTYTVHSVEGRFCSRLMEMGILPGVSLTFIRSAPLRYPIEIEVNGLLLVLRKEEAAGISLEN